ncbi:MAG: hypothetical protein WD021_02015 [Rhodothermales bacterium]
MYAATAVAMWSAPLLSILHVESSAMMATVSYFAAGLTSLSLFRSGARLRKVMTAQEAALLLPWMLLTVSALWQPNCDYVRGLTFFLGFPGVTVVFAVSLAWLLHTLPVRRKRTWLIGIGVTLAIAPTLYDVGFHPQFYTYNHVFGGFLGPIYDEDLAVRRGLYAFRVLTLLWSAMFVAVATWQVRPASRILRGVIAAIGLLVAAGYAFGATLGIITTYDRIEQVLGGVYRTTSFEIYYDPDRTTEADLRDMIDEHLFRMAQFEERLGTSVQEPLRTYVYPNADVKAQLTGARHTSVAPVWLSVPQVHVLASSFHDTFAHELAHVFSREFGLPVLRASVSVGLLEGLAVALEPPDGRPGPRERVSAALLSRSASDRSSSLAGGLNGVVASHLTPWGFWTGRDAISYTTMGSFVRYLLDAYGPALFKRAYATARFEAVYGKPPEVLVAEWTDHLLALDAVSRSTGERVAAQFAVPSLFEKTCPHYVPPHRRLLLEARRYLEAGDTTRAVRSAERSLAERSDYVAALDLWARLALRRGDARSVAARLGIVEEGGVESERFPYSLWVRRGDAMALLGRTTEARRQYDRSLRALPSFAHEARSVAGLRYALASDPLRLRMLIVEEGPHDRPASPDGVERMAAGISLARSRNYEQAVMLLRTTTAASLVTGREVIDRELIRRRYVWLGELSYAAGNLRDAAFYADSARAAYLDAGAFTEAERLSDVGEKMRWLAASTAARTARYTAHMHRSWR